MGQLTNIGCAWTSPHPFSWRLKPSIRLRTHATLAVSSQIPAYKSWQYTLVLVGVFLKEKDAEDRNKPPTHFYLSEPILNENKLPKQVATHADDCIIRRFQAYVALVCPGCFLGGVAISAGWRIIWRGCASTHRYVLGASNIVIQHQNNTSTFSAKTYVALRMRSFGRGSKTRWNEIICYFPWQKQKHMKSAICYCHFSILIVEENVCFDRTFTGCVHTESRNKGSILFTWTHFHRKLFMFHRKLLTLTCTHAYFATSFNMAATFQQEYMQMPAITRAYTTACVLTTIAVVGADIYICEQVIGLSWNASATKTYLFVPCSRRRFHNCTFSTAVISK